MDQRTIQILFALLRSAFCGTKLTEEERNNYSPDLLKDLLKISSKHDVVHLLVFGLKQNELISKENSDIEKCILKAVYRYVEMWEKHTRLLQNKKYEDMTVNNLNHPNDFIIRLYAMSMIDVTLPR